jgi:hypothetical protein
MPPSVRRQLARVTYLIPPALLVALLVLWVRSALPEHFFLFSRAGALRLVFVDGNWVTLFATQGGVPPVVNRRLDELRMSARQRWEVAGVEFVAGPGQGSGTFSEDYRLLSVSYLYLLLPTFVASAWCLFAMRRAAPRWRAGHCHTCGYDLRGGTSTCPECGETSAGK